MEWALPAVVLFCVFSTIAAFYAVHMATEALIEVKAMQKSTHNIQFVPAEPPVEDREFMDAMAAAELADYRRAGEIHQESEPLM